MFPAFGDPSRPPPAWENRQKGLLESVWAGYSAAAPGGVLDVVLMLGRWVQLASISLLAVSGPDLRQRPWRPLASDDAFASFDRDALRVTAQVAPLPLDLRDAVREVVLARAKLEPVEALSLADAIYGEATRLGYDPLLALAIIQVESRFDPKALSPKGALGLMQLMPSTKTWIQERAIFRAGPVAFDESPPVEDVRAGVRYLAHLQRSFGRVDRALQAYNCGPHRLRLVLKREVVLPFETELYAQRVLRRYRHLVEDYAYLQQRESQI